MIKYCKMSKDSLWCLCMSVILNSFCATNHQVNSNKPAFLELCLPGHAGDTVKDVKKDKSEPILRGQALAGAQPKSCLGILWLWHSMWLLVPDHCPIFPFPGSSCGQWRVSVDGLPVQVGVCGGQLCKSSKSGLLGLSVSNIQLFHFRFTCKAWWCLECF